MDNKKEFKSFSDFTNLYEVSKTLRFELKPIGRTKELLDKHKVFDEDKQVLENYKKVKKYFDLYHQEFIYNALKLSNIDFSDFQKAYIDYKGTTKIDKKNAEKVFKKIEDKYRKEIVKLFNDNARIEIEKYNSVIDIKKEDLGFLFEKEIFEILKERFKDDEGIYYYVDNTKKDIFSVFTGFTTYFVNFYHSRENFYDDDGKASAVATRIINENLIKFLNNVELFNQIKNKVDLQEDQKNIFNINYYNKCLVQEDINKYNIIIGDINKKINEYSQQSGEKFGLFKILYNQILGKDLGENNNTFIEINNDNEVFDTLNKFDVYNNKNIIKFKDSMLGVINQELNSKEPSFNIDEIYLAKRFINTISGKWFLDWRVFEDLISDYFNNGNTDSKKRREIRKEIPEFIKLGEIKNILLQDSVNEINNEDLFKEKYINIINPDSNKYINFLTIFKKEIEESLESYYDKREILKDTITKDGSYDPSKEAIENIDENTQVKYKVHKRIIKDFLDSSLVMYQIAKYFLIEKNGEIIEDDFQDREPLFYNDLEDILKDCEFFDYYAIFRDYLTKKIYSEDKIKLNFGNGQLLNGWDRNKEKQYNGIMFRKDNKYYLGILIDKKIFDDDRIKLANEKYNGPYYEKLFYKFLPDPKKMLPKVCFCKKGLTTFKPTDHILNIYNNGLFKIDNPNFKVEYMQDLIDFYKQCLSSYPDWQIFDFTSLKDTKDYKNNIGEFYNDIVKNSYRMWFENIPEAYIEENVANDKLYLFQIYNKDFSPESKSDKYKNMHTLYWNNLFSNENMENPILKLNGEAEIFFREKSSRVEYKQDKSGKKVIDHKRYYEDKIFFHCPITLNFGHSEYNDRIKEYNVRVNELLVHDDSDIHIMGIDRGEKNLIYYSILDRDGNIIESQSLNVIENKNKKVDYLSILSSKEIDRDRARKSWQEIENIKEIKSGYLSNVVKILYDKIIQYNAIIILEDLNSGFKTSRQKIERQVYQNFELALINKLSYLVKKDETDIYKAGSVLKAYQLTPFIQNYKDVYKQTGILFFTIAGYTSRTCPNCGFRRDASMRFDYKTIDSSISLLNNRNFNIEYNGHYFDITFENNIKYKYQSKNEEEHNQKLVKLNTKDAQRYKWHKTDSEYGKFINVGESIVPDTKTTNGVLKKYDITECLIDLFNKYNITLDQGLTDSILSNTFDSNFYKRLFYLLELLMEIRNSIPNTEHDYIKCPCCNFDSEKNKFNGFDWNGDANGAYNIARKGIIMLDKIEKFALKDDLIKIKYDDFVADMEDWDSFVSKQ